MAHKRPRSTKCKQRMRKRKEDRRLHKKGGGIGALVRGLK